MTMSIFPASLSAFKRVIADRFILLPEKPEKPLE